MSGAVSLQMLVILVPVIFGFMGFALDLGRLYLIRGELNQAADAMAVAAAQRLVGATASNTLVQNVLPAPLGNGPSYTYNFGALTLGQPSGNLSSTIAPLCFDTVTDAVANTNGTSDCSTATAIQVTVSADAPLLFFGLLPVAQSRSTPVAAQAIAGMSAPLCTGCGMVPIAVPALNTGDPVDFGFDPSKSTVYTLYYACAGTPIPTALAGANGAPPAPYVLINRYDTASALPEGDQLFQYNALGLTASNDPTPNTCTAAPTTPFACVNIGDCEQFWASAAARACTAAAPSPSVEAALCGLYSRLDSPSNVGICSTVVPDLAALDSAAAPDTDLAPGETPPYSDYLGNGRRLITAAIVQGSGSSMTVLGFRQFLIEPNPDGTFFNPADANGRFPALYAGSPAPMPQGWFDTRYAGAMCPVGSFSGPGKVVLQK
ncbi:MAG TPA: pilus assembly protein TadG-related protein [Bryobacteraceae bacterium]|nr:pilus assembly protein TadG-related protein [Bryobacteraceae bacterium]